MYHKYPPCPYILSIHCRAILVNMEAIKVLKNCIRSQDAQSIIDYINKNQDSFDTGPKRLRFQRMFGDDHYHGERSAKVISGVDEIQEILKTVIDLSIKSIADKFKEDKDIYLASLWLAKQIPGAEIRGHVDTDSGINYHYAYSAILYLNTPYTSSPLEFPLLGLAIKPEFGDLVVFKSADKTSFHRVKIINEDRYSIPLWFTKDKNYELKFGE